MPTATAPLADVPNHRRFAPAPDVLKILEQRAEATADAIADKLDLSTRDVVATLNLLAGSPNPVVRRHVLSDPADPERVLAARWSLA